MHFINGYYDYLNDTFIAHNHSFYDIAVIPWECSPSKFPCTYKYIKTDDKEKGETEPLHFLQWLNDAIPDRGDQKMLLQYWGTALTLDTSHQKFLIICGSGGTGKSTILSVIESTIGKRNISNVSLQGLQKQFSTADLYHKQANICADIPLTALEEVDMIKKITGEDTIYAERKFKDSFTFKSNTRLFFSANDIPINLSDRSNAFYRRMYILRMDQKPKVTDPHLLTKLLAEIPYIISLLIDVLRESKGKIEESNNSKELVKMAHKNSDTVEAFIDDCCLTSPEYRISRSRLYMDYQIYCNNEGRKYLTANKFFKALETKGYNQVKGTTRDFIGIKRTNTMLLSCGNVI